ncbi:hypothetical protein HQO44_21880 [Rhodococcus fascians]|nr:hypothetical protein [Rhodococcus fascians]
MWRRPASHRVAVRVATVAIDVELSAQRVVVPGLGDAGDRQFGPR